MKRSEENVRHCRKSEEWKAGIQWTHAKTGQRQYGMKIWGWQTLQRSEGRKAEMQWTRYTTFDIS